MPKKMSNITKKKLENEVDILQLILNKSRGIYREFRGNLPEKQKHFQKWVIKQIEKRNKELAS